MNQIFAAVLVAISTVTRAESEVFYNSCRYRDGENYPLDLFPLVTCAWCYLYTPPYRFKPNQQLNPSFVPVNQSNHVYYVPGFRINGSLEFADRRNEDLVDFMADTFASSNERLKWLSCCDSAEACCEKMITTPPSHQPHCPRTWDGWLCWEDGTLNRIEKERCPWFIYTGDAPSCQLYAMKECLADGEWFSSQQLGEFTNYTCNIDDFVETRTVYHITMHSLSLLFSIPAVVIFFYYRTLNNHRFIIHRNLILALCLHNIGVIALKAALFLGEFEAERNGFSIIAANGVACRTAVWFDKFANMAVFTWMLCEGIYLHQIIAAAFREEQKIYFFYLLGWAVPFIPSIAWAASMALNKDYACWITEVGDDDNLIWIMDSSRLATLIINVILLANIVRVLFTKLRAVNTSSSTHVRKMVKATVFLIPVFGVQFFVTGIKPSTESCISEQIYYYVAYLFDGFHGFAVALVYCYLNNEVQQQLRRTLNKSKLPFIKNRRPNRGGNLHFGDRNRPRRPSTATELSSVDGYTNATDADYSETQVNSTPHDEHAYKPELVSAVHNADEESRAYGASEIGSDVSGQASVLQNNQGEVENSTEA